MKTTLVAIILSAALCNLKKLGFFFTAIEIFEHKFIFIYIPIKLLKNEMPARDGTNIGFYSGNNRLFSQFFTQNSRYIVEFS